MRLFFNKKEYGILAVISLSVCLANAEDSHLIQERVSTADLPVQSPVNLYFVPGSKCSPDKSSVVDAVTNLSPGLPYNVPAKSSGYTPNNLVGGCHATAPQYGLGHTGQNQPSNYIASSSSPSYGNYIPSSGPVYNYNNNPTCQGQKSAIDPQYNTKMIGTNYPNSIGSNVNGRPGIVTPCSYTSATGTTGNLKINQFINGTHTGGGSTNCNLVTGPNGNLITKDNSLTNTSPCNFHPKQPTTLGGSFGFNAIPGDNPNNISSCGVTSTSTQNPTFKIGNKFVRLPLPATILTGNELVSVGTLKECGDIPSDPSVIIDCLKSTV